MVGTYINTKDNRHFAQRGVNSVEEYASQSKGTCSLIAEAIYEQKIKEFMLSPSINIIRPSFPIITVEPSVPNVVSRTAETYAVRGFYV